ncbi:MAG: MBL fold metallo-hydrolase [Burkholderiaceae bacterium]
MITVRPHKRLHPARQLPEPRPAATILLLRDADEGPQVLMTRRSPTASFAPGAYVFPGGTLDLQDSSPLARRLSAARPDQSAEVLGFAAAAAREAFEELGILLTHGATPAELASLAARLDRSQQADFFAQLAQHDLRLALDEVMWFSHWITDRDLPKRFDTRFFVARMPAEQQPVADEGEQFEPTWVAPAEGLARHERGEFNMMFPTVRTLRQLTRFRSVDEVLDHSRDTSRIFVSCPRGGLVGGKLRRFTEDELPFGELELVTPDGQVEHEVVWQHERWVPLLRHVYRLTAPNPGRMTGPGTNTYLIGEPGNWLVIDPGPADETHIDRIAAMVGDGLKTIVCTHAHQDHAPGALLLRQRTGIPVLGRPTGPYFDPAWAFTPDRTLADGELLRAGDSTLRVLHTPGHTEHHICLLLEEDGLLFSGDHILSGSTTVITPPDGSMLAYIDSLRRLAREPFHFILPAHGHVITDGKREIDRLIAHRFAREAKVLAALQRTGGGTLDELVEFAYDDVDRILYPVAKRSLLAHLLKLRDEERAADDGGRWTLQKG